MPDAAVAGPPGAGQAEKARLKQAHILIVDDDPQIVTLCKHYLESAEGLAPQGFTPRVHTAHGGESALDVVTALMAQGDWLACALVDVVMPNGIDGFETIREIWKLDPGVPCTLVTGNADRVEAEIESRLPAHLLDRWDYVAKPFTRFEIVQRVRRSLAIWYGQQQEGRNQELERALRDLETAQTQLLQQEKMACIGQLAAGVAHELNNPIGFVHSNLGTLRRYVDKLRTLLAAYEERVSADEELKRIRKELKIDFVLEDLPALVEESEEGTERMRKIVSDLKVFSHPSENEPEYADLNEGLKSTLNIVHNEIKYKARVVQDLGDIPPVRCFPGQVNQVFMNLLINAGQALGEEADGEVRVATRREGDQVVITIADTGCGIPEDVRARIFDPFFTTKKVGSGTGLGLSITYDIVRKHGGTIAVESEVGKGTTFAIRLPIEGGTADGDE